MHTFSSSSHIFTEPKGSAVSSLTGHRTPRIITNIRFTGESTFFKQYIIFSNIKGITDTIFSKDFASVSCVIVLASS